MGLNTVAQLTHIPIKKKKLLKIEIFRLSEIDILHWLSCCVLMDTTHLFVCGDGCVCESEGLSYRGGKLSKSLTLEKFNPGTVNYYML